MPSISLISQANLDTQGLLSAFVLAERRIELLIADRTSLRTLIPLIGNVSGAGSDTMRDRRAGLGASLPMTATAAETTSVSASSVDVETGSVAAARHALAVDQTFFATIVDDTGQWNPRAIAETMLESWEAGFMVDLATAGATFTTALGSNTAALDVDTWLDMIEDFEEDSVDGQINAMLHSRAVGQLRRAVAAEGGVLANKADAESLTARKNLGMVGRYMDVDIFMSNRVTESTGKQNFSWVNGAIKQAIGTTERLTLVNGIARPAGTPLVIGIDETHASNKQLVVANGYWGVGVVYDGKGRLLRSAA